MDCQINGLGIGGGDLRYSDKDCPADGTFWYDYEGMDFLKRKGDETREYKLANGTCTDYLCENVNKNSKVDFVVPSCVHVNAPGENVSQFGVTHAEQDYKYKENSGVTMNKSSHTPDKAAASDTAYTEEVDCFKEFYFKVRIGKWV